MSKTKMTTPASNAPMPYFSLVRNSEEKTADIYIFGDIAHRRGGLSGLLQADSDQSSYDLANQVAAIPEDYAITVHINSNGGEVKEGLGIYNVLKSRNVTTINEGFAASAASVIFVAGKTRIMQPASLLFIHQASMEAKGNADDFDKAAEDLRIVTAAAVAAYREAGITVDDDQLDAMLKAETWITPDEAIAYGFATQIAEPDDEEDGLIVNDAMRSIMAAVKRPASKAMTIPVNLVTNDEAGLLDVLKDFTATVEKHEDFIALATKALDLMNSDPDLVTKLKAVASLVLKPGHTPKAPAPADKKGFFGFNR